MEDAGEERMGKVGWRGEEDSNIRVKTQGRREWGDKAGVRRWIGIEDSKRSGAVDGESGVEEKECIEIED